MADEKVQDAHPTGAPARRRGRRSAVLELLAVERASVSSVTDPGRAWKVHVADSLTGLEFRQLREARPIADIGSGAGFPGLVLAVALPDARVDLIESVGRKCEFIQRAIDDGRHRQRPRDQRPLGGAGRRRRPRGLRSGDRPRGGRLSTLAELASPLLSDGGVLVAWKGKRDPDEEAQLASAAEELAMRPERDPPRRSLRRQRAPPPAPDPQVRPDPAGSARAGRASRRSGPSASAAS